MFQATKLTKSYGAQTLFQDISMRIFKGERVGLVGPNGAGKTTLFSIIQGGVETDGGKIEFDRGTTIGFLAQESAPAGEETVIQLATSISDEMTAIYDIFRKHPRQEDPKFIEKMDRFVELDGYGLEAKAKRILAGLGFGNQDFDLPARELSGGWIMRAHLARLLVMEPDLLLLDEPTNHLDLPTLGWFQNYLCHYSGALLTISHDRQFLNAICDKIAEIRNGKLHQYQGNYDEFLKQKKAQREQQQAAYENQQKEIAQMQAFISRFRAKANKASQAQARIKQLEKMERIPPPEPEENRIHFKFPQPPRSGHAVVELTDVRQAYGDFVVYKQLNLKIERHERIVLVGPNGTGKSTLLKIMADQVPIEQGTRKCGMNVTVGYYSQQRVDGLDLDQRVIDEASQHLNDQVSLQNVRDLLGAFLFRGDDVYKPVRVLSGGEKSRLALVKILLDPPNLLLLDEPTTHLDISSIDALIAALKQYQGTLVFVSHDVHFIRAMAHRVIKIESGKLSDYPGDYDYYLYKTGEVDEQKGLVSGLSKQSRETPTPSRKESRGMNPKERRRQRAQERQKNDQQEENLKKRISRLESEILSLENEQNTINEKLSGNSETSEKKELSLQAARVAKQLEEKNTEWERSAEQIST